MPAFLGTSFPVAMHNALTADVARVTPARGDEPDGDGGSHSGASSHDMKRPIRKHLGIQIIKHEPNNSRRTADARPGTTARLLRISS